MALDFQTWVTILAIFATIILTIINNGLRKKQTPVVATPSPSPSAKPKRRPEKWALGGNVDKLLIYPIKSCPGIPVDEAVITTLGLKCETFTVACKCL